jgi:hypothetical protein
MSVANNDQPATRAEAQKKLTTTLNRMVRDGLIDIPNSHHFQLDDNGVPVVVVKQIPKVSPKRISQIKDHIQNYLQHQFIYWRVLPTHLDMHPDPISHSHLWGLIQGCHNVTMEDYNWIHHAYNTLEQSPQKLLTLPLKDKLAPCIGRLVSTCSEQIQSVGQAISEIQLQKLSHNHFGLYVLISRIHQLYSEAIEAPTTVESSAQKGKQIAQCLRCLIQATHPSDPRNNLDAEVFVSLKQRCDEISDGNRDTSVSPEPFDFVDWYVKNG